MRSTPDDNKTQLERQLALRQWMLTKGITFVAMGKAIGMTSAGVSKSVRGERMRVLTHRALVERVGVPAHLLPTPLDIPSGPKPKWLTEQSPA